MKTGLILPCYNIERKINLSDILAVIRLNAALHFCFVNNGSSDNTLEILEFLNEESEMEMSVLDIKKQIDNAGVIRAGERYLCSKKDFDQLQTVCLDFNLKLDALVAFIEAIIVKKKNPKGKKQIRQIVWED